MKSSDILDKLPDRPLKRNEYQTITNKDNIVDSIAFYGGLANPSSFGEQLVPGFVLATEKNVITVAHLKKQDEESPRWYVLSSLKQNEEQTTKELVHNSFSELTEKFNSQSGLRSQNQE